MENLIKKIASIQGELKAPKGQYNSFGKYKYRSCEDILEAVKPLLVKHQLLLTITDDIVVVGDRIYVKATVKITDGKNEVFNSAFAREEETKKGMEGSQVTGASSSYARKYALNGMFCIDDTKDSDATNIHGNEQKSNIEKVIAEINGATTIEKLTEIHKANPDLHQEIAFMNALSSKKKTLKNTKQ